MNPSAEEEAMPMSKIALLLSLLVLPLSLPAQAQQICTNRSDVLGHLANKYSEAPVALGLASNGGVIEVLSSNSGKTWTIIITMPNGISCMLAAGEGWERLPPLAVVRPAGPGV